MEYKLDTELSPALEPYRQAIAATIKPYLKIQLTDNSQPTWWQSKFGGMPYMPKDFEYPQSAAGEYLYLLAQINFAEIPAIEGLPDRGILQFYLADDGMYGCDLGKPTKQDKFRVIYFENGDLTETDLVTDFNWLSQPKRHNFPLQGCSGLEFEIDHAPIGQDDYRFNIFGDGDIADELDEAYWSQFDLAGHKLLGYPNFTQDDPRYGLKKGEPYILLLQIDSDRHDQIEIMWGDMGIGNFFIRESDLRQLDFSRVLYNWDCS